jgi:hypothetical protein
MPPSAIGLKDPGNRNDRDHVDIIIALGSAKRVLTGSCASTP